jgi:hypothetical protein
MGTRGFHLTPFDDGALILSMRIPRALIILVALAACSGSDAETPRSPAAGPAGAESAPAPSSTTATEGGTPSDPCKVLEQICARDACRRFAVNIYCAARVRQANADSCQEGIDKAGDEALEGGPACAA